MNNNSNSKYNNRNNKKNNNKIKLTTSNKLPDNSNEIGVVFGMAINILNIGSQFLSGLASLTGDTSGWSGITEHFENTILKAKDNMIKRAKNINPKINKIIGIKINTSEISGGSNKDGMLVVLIYGTAIIENTN